MGDLYGFVWGGQVILLKWPALVDRLDINQFANSKCFFVSVLSQFSLWDRSVVGLGWFDVDLGPDWDLLQKSNSKT